MGNNQLLQQSINKDVSLEGTTADDKASAVLLVSDNPVYIEGLNYWPKNLIDKQIVVTGKLVLKKYIPKAETDKNGLTSQGGSGGNDYVLEQAIKKGIEKELGFKGIMDLTGFPEGQHQKAIKAIISELQSKEYPEEPKEFFVKLETDTTASNLAFQLVHRDSFKLKNLNKIGNPSGKDRKAIYSLVTKKVTFLFYQ